MLTLLNTIKNTFSPSLVGHLAARLGESQARLNLALEGAVPLVLDGMISKVGSGDAELVYALCQRACHAPQNQIGNMTGWLGILGSGNAPGSALAQGTALLTVLFGTSSSLVVRLVSDYAGIKGESATALLRMAGAVLPALLGQHAAKHGLNVSSMAVLLLKLKAPVRAMLPQYLRVQPELFGPNKVEIAAAMGRPLALSKPKGVVFMAGTRWGRGLVVIVGLVLVVYFFLGSGTVNSSPVL